MTRATLLLTLGALFGMLAGVAPAAAATYVVHNCELPTGDRGGSSGWAFTILGPRTGNLTCRPTPDDSRPAMAGWLMRGAVHENNERVQLTYSAPPGTEIAAYTIWRTVDVQPASTHDYYYRAAEGQPANLVERCEGQQGCHALRGSFARVGLTGVHQLWLTVGCSTSQLTCPVAYPAEAAAMGMSRADVTLRDDELPVLTSTPSGTLLDGQRTLTGRQEVSVAAADVGGGVYQVLYEVDGKVVAAGALAPDSATCQVPFRITVPCPQSAARTLSFNTESLEDGEHLLRILVTDATGTNAVPYGPVRIHTLNGACKLPPTPGARLKLAVFFDAKRARKRRTLTIRYGRGVALRGRLTGTDGKPIAGARICVATRVPMRGAALAARDSLETDADGRFRYRLGKGPTRLVRFVYRSPAGEVVASELRLRVSAALSLHATPTSLHNGQRVRLRGKLAGRPFPGRGTLVEFQAWRPHRWQTFATARADRRGGFGFSYRFTRTTGTQTYRLRAHVPRQAGYPYAPGASRPVKVRVRG